MNFWLLVPKLSCAPLFFQSQLSISVFTVYCCLSAVFVLVFVVVVVLVCLF